MRVPRCVLPVLVVALAAPRPSAAEAPAISHAGVGCAVAEKFPRLEARIRDMDLQAEITKDSTGSVVASMMSSTSLVIV